MSAHQSHREIPAAYFKAVRAARAIFTRRFSHFKWNNPGEVFDSPRDEYFSTLDSLLKELVQRVRTLTLTCAPKNVTSRLTYHCQGDDPALLVYRECCERACYTLMSRGVQVERIPSWENTERAPEHIRKHNYMNRLLAENRLPADESKKLHVWLEHRREEDAKRDQRYWRNADAGLQYLVRVLREPFVDTDHPVCI